MLSQQMDLETIPIGEIGLVEERNKVETSKNMEFENENKQLTQNTEYDECNEWTPEKDSSIFREKNKKIDSLKDGGKQEMAKQAVKEIGKIVKGDLSTQRVDRASMSVLSEGV